MTRPILPVLSALAVLSACASPVLAPDAPAPQETPVLRPADAPLMVWSDLTGRPRPTPTVESAITGAPRARDGEPLPVRGDLWLPDGPGPYPVVLMIHGGCWQKAIADHSLMDWAAADLMARGFAVWNVEYRGVDEAPYPATFFDVAESADYLGLLGEQLSRLDTERVVALGHSAGGHLALWLAASASLPTDHPATMGAPPALRGVVSTGGLQDLEAAEPVTLPSCLAAARDRLVGSADATRLDPYADTSPARMLPLGVPQVAIHADRDRIAPVSLGAAWAEKARAAGDEARLVVVPGGHVELIAPGTVAWARTVEEIERLIAQP